MIKVVTIEDLLKIGKHLLLVNDRIPPMFIGTPNHPLQHSVGLYRKILRWRDEGVKYVIISYHAKALVGFNQPWSEYYIWTTRLLAPSTRMEPLKF